MNKLIALPLLMIAAQAAQANNNLKIMAEMQQEIPTGQWEGKAGKNAICAVSTRWDADNKGNPQLTVLLEVLHKDDNTREMELVFNAASQELEIEYGDANSYLLIGSQEFPATEDDETTFTHVQTLEFIKDEAGKLKGFSVRELFIDYESDPSESDLHCWKNLKRVL